MSKYGGHVDSTGVGRVEVVKLMVTGSGSSCGSGNGGGIGVAYRKLWEGLRDFP